MADELSDYLQGAYIDEKRDIERLKETGSRVLDVFDRFFIQNERVWPYEVVRGQEIPAPEAFSFSTNAMIVFALAVATGMVSRSELIPSVRIAPIATRGKEQLERLVENMKNALARFPLEIDKARGTRTEVRKWTSAQRERRRPRDNNVQLATTSKSFGPNDPLTLTWLLEVLGEGTPAEPEVRQRLRAELTPAAREIVTSAFEQPDRSPLRLPFDELVPHAFPLLRVLHLFNTAGLQGGGWQPARGVDLIHNYLLNRAHFHLSSISVQDGGFDAGELVFSLEGVLLCDPSLPDYSLFDRAFEVLAERQRETPYWRPLRPFRVTSRGMVLLPQSVEIANSLLRICSRLDEGSDRSYFSDYVGLFKAYTRWLESRMFVGRTKDQKADDIFGWQSEHTFAPDRIHLWQTSQALLYLIHYGAMLQGHIARRSFKAARLLVSVPSSGKPDAASWNKWEKSEPMGSLSGNGPYAIYRVIRDSIIRPRELGGRPDPKWDSSALLHGPPGTGKSRIAEEIARGLGYRLVTITPSDFITAGQEAVEARAKNIFATLMQQTDLVVLFDEVDQLLLDRGSNLYRIQGDIFKLITPGMLTKLNDLTKRKEVVFLIATNFFERIDPAVKRSGRINLRLLVLPPDRGQRMRFLAEGPNFKGPLFLGWETIGQEGQNAVVDQTALHTYGELQDLAKRFDGVQGQGDGLRDKILDACSKFVPTISVASYRSRVLKKSRDDAPEEPNEEGPLDEFLMVVYIAAESRQIKDRDREWVGEPLRVAWEDWRKRAPSRERSRVGDVFKDQELLALAEEP